MIVWTSVLWKIYVDSGQLAGNGRKTAIYHFVSSPEKYICILCHNVWTNWDTDPFSTSKWPSEPQFCEKYQCGWQKNDQNWAENAHNYSYYEIACIRRYVWKKNWIFFWDKTIFLGLLTFSNVNVLQKGLFMQNWEFCKKKKWKFTTHKWPFYDHFWPFFWQLH